MEQTVLFAGHYFNKTIELTNQSEAVYNMGVAFLLTTAAYFFVTLILMVL